MYKQSAQVRHCGVLPEQHRNDEGLLCSVTHNIAEVLNRDPAITANYVENIQWKSMDVDAVFALPCPEWPKEADLWPTRQRSSGWPSKQLNQGVIADGCHVVPMSHCKSRNPDIEWRYSFSVAERTLAQSLTDSQRQCFILLKTVVMHELSHSNVLTSYHMKTVFFWQCEKIPVSEWSTETGLAASLLWLLDELVYCVATHCLPHYLSQRTICLTTSTPTSSRTSHVRLVVSVTIHSVTCWLSTDAFGSHSLRFPVTWPTFSVP